MQDTQNKAYLSIKKMARVLDKRFQHKIPAREEMVLDPTELDENVQMVVLEKNVIFMSILLNSFMTNG